MLTRALEAAIGLALLPATATVHTAVRALVVLAPLESDPVVARMLALAEDLDQIA